MELKKEKYTFEDFVNIIKRLREPDGCPWDREQTHESIRKNLVEEAYELVEAIDSKNAEKIADESGDVLLQVVLHAQIASDNGEYDINDVVDIVSRKMIHRHPHVFGDKTVKNSDEVVDNWAKIKREDRNQKTVTDDLKGVSKYIPTLMRAQKIYKKAVKAGYFYDNEEIGAPDELEIGKKLFDIAAACTKNDIDLEIALSAYIEKFISDFEKYEEGNIDATR